MLRYNLFRNNRAQIAETITWVVATLIIIFLLITSIYFSSILGKSKSVNKDDIKISSGEENWIDTKNNLAYTINSENKEKIEIWINGVENDK